MKAFTQEKVDLIKQLEFDDKEDCINYIKGLRIDDTSSRIVSRFVEGTIQAIRLSSNDYYEKILNDDSIRIFNPIKHEME